MEVYMRKTNYKGRCEKKVLSKCKVFFVTLLPYRFSPLRNTIIKKPPDPKTRWLNIIPLTLIPRQIILVLLQHFSDHFLNFIQG